MTVSKSGLGHVTSSTPTTTTTTSSNQASPELTIPDGPLTFLPPVSERSYKEARRLFSALFHTKTPDLELKASADHLGEGQLRKSLVQFARTSGLDMPREVFTSRAAFAEQRAIGASSIKEKVAWLTLAFDSFVAAARYDQPSGFRRSQKDAAKTATLIASIAETKGERHYWSAAAALLLGDTDSATEALTEAARYHLPEDLADAVDALTGHIDHIGATVAIERSVVGVSASANTPRALERIIAAVNAIAESHPVRSLRCAVISLEAQRQLAALDGDIVETADAVEKIDGALNRAVAALADDITAIEGLRGERDLLVARTLFAGGKADEAEALLGPVARGLDAGRARDAKMLLAEIAIHTRPEEAPARFVAAAKATPSVEVKAMMASAFAGVIGGDEPALTQLDNVIKQLSSRGAAATYSSGGQSIVTARVVTKSKKPVELPATTLTADEAFLLSDARTNRALLLTSLGRAEEALDDLAGNSRLGRAIARLAVGRVEDARQDLAYCEDRRHPRLASVLEHPVIAAVARGETVDDPAVVRRAAEEIAKRVLTDGTSDYLSAASAYPLAAASDFPVTRLFESAFTERPGRGVASMGTYEAHLAMSATPIFGLARGTEEPASAASRALDPLATHEMAGMVNSLLSRRTLQKPTVEILDNVLGREAIHSATEHLELATLEDPELEAFVAEQLALEDHTRALTLGCTDPGLMKQVEALLERHGSLESNGPPAAKSADQLLGHLSAISSMGRLTPSKKAKKARDEDGTLRIAWREISGAVKTGELESLKTLDEARTAVRRLGFRVLPGQTELFERNGAWVRLAEQNIGEAEGYSLQVGQQTLSGAFQEYRQMVSVDGLTFEGKHWRYFKKGYERTSQRYATAMRRMVGHPNEWRSDMKGVRALIGLGRSFGVKLPQTDGKVGSKKFEMGMELHTIAAQASAAIERLKASGRAPKGVMIMVDGIDAASKTSNGERLMGIFEKAGYDGEWRSFKAPTPEEREQHWLQRYDAHRPAEGQVFMCDRSPLGDYAYNRSLNSDDLTRMADDFREWQEDMEEQGILVLNFLFYPGVREGKSKRAEKKGKEDVPDLWRPMFTFGKREGRALAAREMLMRAKAAGAPEDVLEGLAEAADLHPGINDLRSFHDGVLVHRRFRAFADAIETEHRWKIIPTERRHKGRKRVLRFAVKRLEGLEAE